MILRATEQHDVGALQAIAMDSRVRATYRMGPTHISPADLWSFIVHDAALNLTVLDRRGQPIGLLRLYGLNNRDLTARMSVMMAPTAHATGTGLVAAGQLIDEAFAAFPIRKIYVEAAAAALSLYHRGTVEIIQIEGQLKSHQWNGTMFEDVFVGAIYRERWLGSTIRRRLIRTGRLKSSIAQLEDSAEPSQAKAISPYE